jgi:hypothetical protein
VFGQLVSGCFFEAKLKKLADRVYDAFEGYPGFNGV